MNKFKTLFLMQLKEKLNLSFLKSKKQLLFKVVFSVLGFAVVTAGAYLILWLCQFLNLFSAINRIPLSVMAIVFFVIFVFNLFTCTVGLSKTLYYAKDNQVLITFPVTPNQLFLSKMLVYYVYEIKKTFNFVIPIFFAFGFLSGFSVFYYFWMIIMLVLFASVPVLLGGLLSIPTNYIIRFLNKYPIIKIILLCLVLAGVVAGVWFVINSIPENINLIRSWTTVSIKIREVLEWATKNLYPFYAFIIFLCGKYVGFKAVLFTEYSWIVFLAMIGVIGVLILFNYLLSRPFYLKMASKQFEFEKKSVKRLKNNHKFGGFLSSCVYETKRSVRNTYILSSFILTLIVAPIAVLLLNKIYGAISTRRMGDYLITGFNVLIILLFVVANNINVSSVYSRDGDSWPLNRVKPVKPFKVVLPKLAFNVISSLIILVITSAIFMQYSTFSTRENVYLFVMLLFVTLAHIVWSADLDFVHPSTDLFKTEGASAISKSEIVSTILAFVVSLLTFGLTMFFLIEGGQNIMLRLMIFAIIFFAIRLWLFLYKVKVLYREA
ncbi:MAG: hypothetical protein IJS74_03610 [Clostridia bacterium]|nr:hypothetical protein [Clostridia bacterium]